MSDLSWITADAVCRTVDPELFFTDAEQAKTICATCPLQQPCATYALTTPDVVGVWGGLTDADRGGRGMRRLLGCGTRAGNERHLYYGELPCTPCDKAARDYKRKYDRKRAAA